MNTRSRIARGLGATLLLGGALLAAAPGATAATPTALIPPQLTEANYFDPWINLGWEPSATADDTEYIDVLADGKQVAQLDANSDAGAAGRQPVRGGSVNVDTTGADPTATYTLVAEDAAGNKSAPSNGLVPVNQEPLPRPVMKSAVISGDKVTVSFGPTVTNAASVTYHVLARGGYEFGTIKDATTGTVDRTISIDTGPTGTVTQTIQPGDSVWVYAQDSNGDRSPYSNDVGATEG